MAVPSLIPRSLCVCELQVRVALIYISGYHSMASVMRKELVDQLNASMKIFKSFNNRQLHDQLRDLAPSTPTLIDCSVNGKREQGEWLDSLHIEVLLRLLFITAGVTDEARIGALFTVSTNPNADLGLFHKVRTALAPLFHICIPPTGGLSLRPWPFHLRTLLEHG